MRLRDKYKRGFVDMIILTLLREEDMYGYQIAAAISGRTNGVIEITEASLYPTLHNMVEKGYIKAVPVDSEGKLKRNYYRLRPEGKRLVKLMWDEYDIFSKGISSIRVESQIAISKTQSDRKA